LNIPTRRSRTEFRDTFPAEILAGRQPFHFYDPLSDFKRFHGEKLYWEREHGHFTPLGCKIVGEGLARTVIDQGLLTDRVSSSKAGGK